MLSFVALLLLAACGGSGGATPRVFPTITPTPVTPVAGVGPFLTPLTGGREETASDARYSISVPADWVAVTAPPAELAFTQPGSSGTGSAISINITREQLPAAVTDARGYAEAGRGRIGQIYANVLPLNDGAVQIGRLPAWRWTYTARAGGADRYLYQVFVIDGRMGFVLTGIAPASADQRAMQALFDGIAGSWTFQRG